MVEENKKILKVENEVLKKPTASGFPRRSPIQIPSRPDDASSVIRRERVGSSWYGRGVIHIYAVAIALLRFGPFARRLSAVAIGLQTFGPFSRSLCAVSCSVIERGTSEWLKKIKRCPK